jgi:beta-1,4-mannosyl-glycoprotein beta-1,4-N-acetylglucosaminyltransferase
MKLFDCFLYNGESKMLNFRLNELTNVVDYFIITEASYTFKGDSKPLTFNIELFKNFKDKIIYVPCQVKPVNDPWQNERNQRMFLKEGFRNISPMSNDLIMLSDVDEIPDTNCLKHFKTEGLVGAKTFYQNFFYYNLECRNTKKWPGTAIIDAYTFNTKAKFNFELLRNARHSFELIGNRDDYTSGGWHFSYFGDAEYIINKIKSFSHQEYNTEEYTNPDTIKKLITDGKDLFFRNDETFTKVPLKEQTYLPNNINLLT